MKTQFYISPTVYQTARIWVKTKDPLDMETKERDEWHNRAYVLDCLCCWGGADKTERKDGVYYASWEIPVESAETVRRIASTKFYWEEHEFWKDEAA